MKDLVSVIMPSYNTAEYIGESIKSVFAQTYENWELIIVDDCSTDSTDGIVAGFNSDKIRYFKNEKNSGAAVSRNKALREAKGRLIAFLDSDDIWEPLKLEKQIKFMKENGYAFSYTDHVEIDTKGNETGVKVTGPQKITHSGFINYCWPGCLTVMYDANVVGLVQVEDIRKNNDYAMWLKISDKADCYLLNEFLAKYRRARVGSVSNHGYLTLIKWHYLLFRKAEKENVLLSIVHTIRNLFFGVLKKFLYIKH